MTDSIDLDEIAVEEEDDESTGNYGDWLWRDGEPPETNESPPGTSESNENDETTAGAEPASTEDDSGQPAPGVPAMSSDPVGIPGNAGEPSDEADETGADETPGHGAGTAETHDATEPDDMTMALTYKAAHYFVDPEIVLSDAHGWADWIGIVGEVSTPVIRKFQRENRIELDFFGGSESGPEARLIEIDRESMFYADRMVLVGTDADEWIADEAGWEFVPVETAAEKADWELRDDL